MEPIDAAIMLLESEIESSSHGTPQQPKDGTTDWFLLRARASGMSLLRRMKQLGAHEDPAAAERFYRQCCSSFKTADIPLPVQVERETIESPSPPA